MIKVGSRLVGEDPEEQLKLEKKRFEAKQRRLSEETDYKRYLLENAGRGSKKLTEFC